MIGVLLLTFGGPARLDEVEPFLSSVLSGRKLTTEQLEKVKEKYKLIGGSPLPGTTFNQAKLLEERLNKENKDFHVYVGFRHSHPTIEETVNQIVKDETKNIVILSLAPYYSKVTTAGYMVELERAIKKNQANFEITVAPHLATHPLYLECLVEKIEQGLKNFPFKVNLQGEPVEQRKEVQIIFSVHSILQKFIDKGDPYLEQVKASIDSIIKISGLSNWRLAFQSSGSDKNKWLEPEIKDVIDELASKGVKNILLVPLSFVSENIETLYDIDIVYKKYAEKKGLNFIRTECLNTAEKFIEALAEIVKESLKNPSPYPLP